MAAETSALAASSAPRFIEAVHEHRLFTEAQQVLLADPANNFARSAVATCETISRAVSNESSVINEALASAGHAGPDVKPDKSAGGQLHTMSIVVSNFAEAAQVSALCQSLGYEPWQPLDGAASEMFRRLNDHLTLVKAGPVSLALIVGWPQESKLDLIPRVLKPSAADWNKYDLPERLWPLYFPLRPLRLGAQRLGLATPPATQLGPFLATPDSLMPALFNFARVASDDLVCDLGCGDGRLVITAGQMGCRAVGIESDPSLADTARNNVTRAGLQDWVEIVNADAERYSWAEAKPDVVFLFLPADVTAALLPDLLTELKPGARVVAHEQHRIDSGIAPQETAVLLGTDSLSVAHLWVAG